MSSSGGWRDWTFQQVVTVALLVVVIILLAANLFKSPPPVVVAPGGAAFDRAAARRDRPADGQKREEDPYIANQVKNTITKNYIPIRDCWNAYVDSNPEVTQGRITVDWQIDLDGDVLDPEIVLSDFANEELTSCLLKVIGKIEFPPPPYGQKEYVAHKFNFRKDDSTGK